MSQAPAPAAQYLRMSREHQRYSLLSQAKAIESYAAERGFKVVRTYCDPGKSGLTLKQRPGLQALLADTLRPDRGFEAVLVLDVSRWGRFQDLDQSAHYEFLCRQAGVSVIYCAEPFQNDGSASAALIKELKRLLAAEYSRELSAKTRAGHLLLARLGFRQGSPLVYGLERVVVDPKGRPRKVLERGRCKAQKDDRIILRHGPAHEIRTLQRIFHSFVVDRQSAAGIAAQLNREAVPFIGQRRWDGAVIRRLLQHELMIGIYVFNRTSHVLQSERVRNPPEEWVRVKVFEPIIDPVLFAKAAARTALLRQRKSPSGMLAGLRRLLRKHGRLSAALINASPDVPAAATYQKYFGTLTNAYAKVGFRISSDS